MPNPFSASQSNFPPERSSASDQSPPMNSLQGDVSSRTHLDQSSPLSSWQSAFQFVFLSFLISRIVILVVFQGLAPHIPMHAPPDINPPLGSIDNFHPQMGWELFTHWDGKWYEDIATRGYTYKAGDITRLHSIVFLPMYPVLSNLVMRLGLPFPIAGTIVNNLCFLGSAYVLYRWVEEFHGKRLAQWTTIALTCFPYSMFGTMAYTEGLFFLSTTVSLRAFDKGQYWLAALSGMVAATTRMFGLALAPTFWIRSWQQRRSIAAYVTGLMVPVGLVIFLVYCFLVHGDFLATFNAQKPWLVSQTTWSMVALKLWKRRLMSPDSWLRVIMFWGSGVMFWSLRRQLNPTIWIYGLLSIGLLLVSGAADGIVRYVYGITSFSVILGYGLMKYPRVRIPAIGLFTLMMSSIAIRFAWWNFIA